MPNILNKLYDLTVEIREEESLINVTDGLEEGSYSCATAKRRELRKN